MNLTTQRRDQAISSAQTWQQFVASMKVNQATIEANYSGYVLNSEDRALLARLPEGIEVLVLAHDWCGDVVANLPLFAKIESETGKLKLHIVAKDPDNVDIGHLYPHADGDVHIPIYVFFDSDGRELGHLIERTPTMNVEVGRIVDEFWTKNPAFDGRGQEFSKLSPEVKTALLATLTRERQKLREVEKRSILAHLETLLAHKPGN